jgi:hypothetical protein
MHAAGCCCTFVRCRNRPWFEEHADFVSVQAMLFNGAARNWWQQTRVLVRYQSRMIE